VPLKYNKEYVKKNGRKLMTGGPRDLQKRQAQQSDVYENLIEDLRKETNDLKKELQGNLTKKTGMFTAEQVDADINKVVNETIKELTIKHKDGLEKKETAFLELSLKTKLKYNKIILEKEAECKKLVGAKEKLLVDLRDQNKFLTEGLCKIKESGDPEILDKLTTLLLEITKKTSSNTMIESDRPQMEIVFIDPLEGDAGKGLESHIDVEEVSIEQKENIQEKVSKLKDLLGGLKT
jgi:hypothetical protein